MNEYINESKLKRISFISGVDFYYLTYLIIICLKEFSSKKNVFTDHRKLTYLMQLVSSSTAVNILIENFNKEKLKAFDREFLFDIYVKGSLHQRDVYKIIRALEKKGVLKISDTTKVDSYNIEILDELKIKSFFDTDIFNREINNAVALKSKFNTISRLGLNGLLDKIFIKHGLKVWDN